MARFKRKKYTTKCCDSTYETKHNGLWNYEVCTKCGNKAELKIKK
jgi:hypothetical protein